LTSNQPRQIRILQVRASRSTSSYNGFVGSPLPYEFDCPNVSIKIAFQGGDIYYAVGAFSIEKPQNRSDSGCKEKPFLCQTTRGGFYRECPFDR